MQDSKYDDQVALEVLRSNPDIRVCLDESEEKKVFFEIDPTHMTKHIPAPINVDDKGHKWSNLMLIYERSEMLQTTFDVWQGQFRGKKDLKHNLESYSTYLENEDSKCSQEVKKMVSCIVYELETFPEKYDATGIFIMLAQNGGVCNVQKEFGIRTVYADMMDSMMDHMKENSVETRVLNLLKKTRYALSEQVAVEIAILNKVKYGDFVNTHYIVPVQNEMAAQIGIDEVPEPNPMSMNYAGDKIADFMKLYTLEHIVKVVSGALNDSHRLINYHDCVEYLESAKPAGVESYAFLNEFVFDMESGKFKEHAIKYMLWKLQILKLNGNGTKHLESLQNSEEIKQKTDRKPTKAEKQKGKNGKQRKKGNKQTKNKKAHELTLQMFEGDQDLTVAQVFKLKNSEEVHLEFFFFNQNGTEIGSERALDWVEQTISVHYGSLHKHSLFHNIQITRAFPIAS
jgi:hypothetical protein